MNEAEGWILQGAVGAAIDFDCDWHRGCAVDGKERACWIWHGLDGTEVQALHPVVLVSSNIIQYLELYLRIMACYQESIQVFHQVIG